MLRQFLIPALMILGSTLALAGCRSCQSCHDYDPPVANCECGTCGCQRSGSTAGYVTGGGYVSQPIMAEELTIDE